MKRKKAEEKNISRLRQKKTEVPQTQNIWDAAKARISRKFTVVSAWIEEGNQRRVSNPSLYSRNTQNRNK